MKVEIASYKSNNMKLRGIKIKKQFNKYAVLWGEGWSTVGTLITEITIEA